MKKILQIVLMLSCSWFGSRDTVAQVNCSDGSVVSEDTYTGQMFFNYGSITNAFSNKNRTSLSVGEPLTGVFAGQQYNGMLGFFSRFLLPPLAPLVIASQGELLDRIQVTWTLDPLSPAPTGGYNIYRDNIYIASVGKNVLSYNDFNVIAGRPYVYKIVGINEFGEGPGGLATGFQVPNGVITGKVSTINGTPVPDALVTLAPLQGFSAKFGYGDGAFFDLDTSLNSILPPAGNSWTITFWVRTDSAASQGVVLRLGPDDLYFRAKNSSSGTNGIEISTTATGTALLSADFPSGTASAWHHIALTFNADDNQGRLYLDGELVEITPVDAPGTTDHIDLGANTEQGNWGGALDELRIYHTLLEEIDLGEVMMSTASSNTPGLENYWKFDEEKGSGSFDIKTRQKIHFCGATFSSDRPAVSTAGKTSEDGYYLVEGVSYGTGVTFLATPAKYFYKYRALRFKRSQSDYAELPDFSLTPKSTLELLINSSGPGGTQTVLSKQWGSNEFRLNLEQSGVENEIVCYLNGSQFNFGNLGMGYQHLALVIDSSGSNRTITLYKNGMLTGTHTFTGISGNWSDAAEPWILGGRMESSVLADAYGGFIDELAVYDSTLSQTVILAHVNDSRMVTEKGLRVYFSLDEGNGVSLSSSGSMLLGRGTVHGAEWSSFTNRQITTPHEFSPATRQVSLNPSVTSVDLVDFIDKSTIPVTGYVRYKNTDCFVPGIEITDEGVSFSPKVLTDSTGKFTLEAESGKSFKLVPRFEDHQFLPSSWEIDNVTTPIAGILFSDVTSRNVTVSVVGGDCKMSTLGDNLGTSYGSLVLQIRNSEADCFERYGTMTDGTTYTFTDVPPLRQLSVGLFSHENNDIKNAIQSLGAITVDITRKDTAVEFVYINPDPEVDIYEGLANDCSDLKYWSPVLPLGSISDFTAGIIRRWNPPLPLGAAADYSASPVKVMYNNTDYFVSNSAVVIGGQEYTYSEHTISGGNFSGSTVTIDQNSHELVASDATAVLDQGDNVTIKLRVQEQYPGGTCILNEADIRFVNGLGDEVKDTSLAAAVLSRTGTVTDHNNNPLANRAVKVRVTLQPTATSAVSDAYYRETHSTTTNSSGVFSIIAGGGTRDTMVGALFSDVPWYPDTEAPYLKLEVDTSLTGIYMQNGGISRVTHPQTTHEYKFSVGSANPIPPYYKTIQIIATTPDGRQGSTDRVAVINGTRPNGERFTTYLPERPTLILRDPPGDASYSYISKDSTVCDAYSFGWTNEQALSLGVEFDAAPEVVTFTGVGVGTIMGTETGVAGGFSISLVHSQIKESGWQTCMTFGSTISTSDADLIVGGDQGGDVYVGSAQNIIFGTSDRVNVQNCVIEADQIITLKPGTPTIFRYSEYYIRRYLIPYLDNLAVAYDGLGKTDSSAIMRNSADLWKSYIQLNVETKAAASFEKNFSFDAGSSYEGSSTTSRDDYDVNENTFSQLASGFFNSGFKIFGAGASQTYSLDLNFSQIWRSEDITSKATTIGYVLADDDAGDAFSVDVLNDPVFETPVFKIKSGQSSCPHEMGTASRDRPSIQPVAGYPLQAINVPSKEPAIFKFNLGNVSQTYESRPYYLSSNANADDNPDGAIIRLNGDVLNEEMEYLLDPSSSVPVIVTVERGPIEYDYDLVITFASGCESERATALGITDMSVSPGFTYLDTLAAAPIDISVSFVRPCSEVDIDYPRDNYVVLSNDPALSPTNSTVRDIIVNNYSLIDPNFQSIRVQYRKADGNGIWTNILAPSNIVAPNPHERWNTKNPAYQSWNGSPKPDTLGPLSTTFKWETAGMVDGNYELRAISICTGAATGMEGSSYYIPVRIEREPPAPIGTPEPADGVLSNGDEISCSFNKLINCNLIQADQINPNNVGLYDTETNELIDAVVSCYENRIIIVPNVANRFIENKVLRVDLHDIEDKTGNKGGPISWEFRVDRNELAWLTDSVGMTKDVHETKIMTASIHNRSGSTVPFKIINSLPWVRVVPDTGVMVANEIKPIQFIVDSTLAIGSWSGVDTLKTILVGNYINGGSEPLKIGARVLCDRPGWNLSAGQYENTMNLVLRVNIQGEFSIDPEDMVAAIIGDELRGRCNVEYVPQLNTYLAYLTVYGTASDLQSPVQLLVWDAQSCLVYASVQESFNFVPDLVVGTPISPQVVHTNDYILRKVPLGIGWNWISFNLQFPDNSINGALEYLKYPGDGLIKSQSSFSSYVSGAGWAGSLTTIGNTSMYNYKSVVRDTLRMIGNLISPDTMPITVVQGWNWIGYIPNYALPINNALESLPSAPGDIIKSQEAFAQYVNATHGWIGNLKFMEPPKGYQIKVANPGTLVYPENSQFRGESPSDRGENAVLSSFWSVNPAQYEYGSTFIGMLSANGANVTTANLELGAFYGNEVRGSAQATFIPSMNVYMFFMTMYSNEFGQPISFKLYNAGTGEIISLSETMVFTPDLHLGTVVSPVPFTLQSTATSEETLLLRNFVAVPNPFRSGTSLQFTSEYQETAEILITDVCGNLVERINVNTVSGLNTVAWNPAAYIQPGIYMAQLKTSSGVLSCKLILQ